MESLLPLYDLCGASTLVKIADVVQPPPTRFPLGGVLSLTEPWVTAWEKCLLENRGAVLAKNA